MREQKKPPRVSHLSAEDLEKLRQLLLAERRRLVDLYQEEVDTAQEIEVEGTGDFLDRAQSSYDRELHFSASDTERELLRQIEEALERIEQGTYGICEHSGEPIPLERLETVPWARYRAEIQEKIERGLPAEAS